MVSYVKHVLQFAPTIYSKNIIFRRSDILVLILITQDWNLARIGQNKNQTTTTLLICSTNQCFNKLTFFVYIVKKYIFLMSFPGLRSMELRKN